MSFIDTVKAKIKATADAVTGNAATVILETTGKFGPGEVISVTLTATSTGNPVESKGAFVDLLGEDDPEESVIEKARELVTRTGDPTHAFEIGGAFSLAAGESKTFTGQFTIPAELDLKRQWLVRGRIATFGNDPNSDYARLS